MSDYALPQPKFASWTDYLERTTDSERMKRCYAAAKRANRVHRCIWRRPVHGQSMLNGFMKENIKGPCACCGSLPARQCFGEIKIKARDVWSIIEQANGRCLYCRSLAVESRPSHSQTGAPLKWEHVGRRIGSLEHILPYLDGRINHLLNLGWACLWCNVHPGERVPFADSNGGYYPEG